ncbi:MAG: hypothetical protein IKK21_06230 [Clostridia bacterium]|nr:hypothetical protein [Clostridia bacterium]
MKLFISILAALGLLTVFFVAFCAGMAYEGQLVEKAAQEGRAFRAPGGRLYRVTPWEGKP